MRGSDERSPQDDTDERAVYIISVAAELAGVHPQTLRIYEQKGLVQPHRTRGNTVATRRPTSSGCGTCSD